MEKEKPKKDYTKVLVGLTVGTFLASNLLSYLGGYNFAWNICNSMMIRKESEYIQRGYLKQDQINEVYEACFGKGS